MTQPALLDRVRDLPERADADLVARVIRVTLGGEVTLRVLTVRENRDWTRTFTESVRAKIAEHGAPKDFDQLAELLGNSIDVMLDLLIAYDVDHVLPAKDYLDENATDREVYTAIKEVVAAAYPFGADLRTLLPELIPFIAEGISQGVATATLALASSESTKRLQQPTAGRRPRSKKDSPTSS